MFSKGENLCRELCFELHETLSWVIELIIFSFFYTITNGFNFKSFRKEPF